MIYNFSFNKIIFFYIFIQIIIFNQNLNAVENKIEYKIDNEIITSLDLKNERNYLTALNPRILELNKKQIFEISKNSIIKEKIKKIEIEKYVKNLEINEKYLSNLIQKNYKKINLNSENEFIKYLSRYDINYEEFKKKIIIEALWNQLIVNKFQSKIKIDSEKLRREILESDISKAISYNLSEIVFDINNKENLNQKYQLIISEINRSGFENASSIYSIAPSSNFGGELGWIESTAINSKLKNIIKKLKINEYSKPYRIPGGFLIVRLNDVKEEEKKIDINNELKKLIISKTNEQLKQYSTIYFNKIKKDKKIEKI